ncbi:NERD domain-containing protein [Brevibacterium sp. S22]|nr:NERD domain-containing protein [Brevibacterium sp. S22]
MLTVPMATSIIVLSLIIVALIALGYLAFKHWNNKFARLHEEHQNATTLAQQRAAEVEQRFNRSQADGKSAHDEELRRLEAKWGEKVAEGKRTIELVRREKSLIAGQLTNTFHTSDLMSRRQIIDACHKLQLDGALLTNIHFSPDGHDQSEKYFYSQADHLLVTSRGISVIEGKYWSMMVFDGVRPEQKLPELEPLLQNLKLDVRNGEVLHIWAPDARLYRTSEAKWTEQKVSLQVRPSPHKQAKMHARRLNQLISERAPSSVNWIDTCVLYSYPGAVVHHSRTANGTTIAATKDELEAFLAGPTFSKQNRLDVKAIVESLQGESGDIVGFGEWREKWPSNLS